MSEAWVHVTEDMFGKCKCCLSELELKSLWDQHEYEGDEEIYGEMLSECFAISWERSEIPEYICEVCVIRLREALEFKNEIIATHELLEEGVKVIKEEDDSGEQLEEIQVEVDVPVSYHNVEYLEEDGNGDGDYRPEDAPSSSESSAPERKRKYPKKLARRDRNKTYKQYTRQDLQNAVQEVQNGVMTCAEAGRIYGVPKGTVLAKVNECISESNDVDEVKESVNEKFYNFIEEIQRLLTYTNAIPFKTKATRYYCFYCSTDGPLFEDADDLRHHTNTKHRKERIVSIEQYMKPQWMNEVIKFDIQQLQCKECMIMLPDWNNMFVHFADTHNVGFDEAYTRVIPYALNTGLECVLCRESFANYGLLDAHMNLHYSNHICFKCGDTFLSTSRLEKHLLVHKTGNFPCKKCDKVFALKKYMTKHYQLVHEQKTPKCMYCKEQVVGPLHLHISEKHSEKVKPLTCEVCGKVFTWKPYFVAHMRRIHNGIKKHKCEYCSKMFLMPYELSTHVKIHTRARVFECGECKATFNTITSLKKHITCHK